VARAHQDFQWLHENVNQYYVQPYGREAHSGRSFHVMARIEDANKRNGQSVKNESNAVTERARYVISVSFSVKAPRW